MTQSFAWRKEYTIHSISDNNEYMNVYDGVTIQIIPVSFDNAESYYAKYDGEPLTESHTRTDAKLVVKRIDILEE